MSIPTPPPMLGIYPDNVRPVSQITPFTYRDGLSYLKILETLIDYVNTKLVGYIQLSMDDIVQQLNTSIEELSQQIASNEVEYNKLLDDYMSSVEYRIMEINNKSGQLPIRRYQVTDDMVVDVEPVWPDQQQIILQFTQDYLGHDVEFKSTNAAPSPLPDATNGWTSTSSQWWPGHPDINAGRRPDTNGYVTRRDISGPSSVISRIENIGGINIPALHGREHTVSVYTHCTATDDYTVQLHVSTDVENFDSPKLAATVDEQGWARTVYTFTMPTTTDVLNVSATVELADGKSVGGEEVWWTDAQVEQGDAPTSYRGVFVNPHNVRVSREPLSTTQVECTPQPDGTWGINVGQSNLKIRNVLDYGCTGDGIADDTAGIQAALKGGLCNVFFPKGEYRVTEPVHIYDSTNIDLGGSTVINDSNREYVFINGELDNKNFADGYNGCSNIRVYNGILDGSPKLSRREYGQFFGFAHATNIELSDLFMSNSYMSHMVEFNSLKNSKIIRCSFNNLVTNNGASSREFINIDFCRSDTFPAFGGYDLTPCKDILVDGCNFYGGDDGVGSHTVLKDSSHERISIANCVFDGLIGRAITPRNWIDSSLTGNDIKSINRNAISIEESKSVAVTGNNFINVCTEAKDGAIYIKNSDYCCVSGNIISHTDTNPTYTDCVRLDGVGGEVTKGNVIDGNSFPKGSRAVVYSTNHEQLIIDGIKMFTVPAMGTVKIVEGSQAAQGVLIINTETVAHWGMHGMYRFRCSPAAIFEIAAKADHGDQLYNEMVSRSSLDSDSVGICVTSEGVYMVSNHNERFGLSVEVVGKD